MRYLIVSKGTKFMESGKIGLRILQIPQGFELHVTNYFHHVHVVLSWHIEQNPTQVHSVRQVCNRSASLRLFCYPGNRFLIRSVNRVTVHNSEICKKGPKQK